MRTFPRAEPIVIFASILLLASTMEPSATLAEIRSTTQSWAAIGVGLAPSPYGLDANGSPVGDIAIGMTVREQFSFVAAVAHFKFFGSAAAQFTPVLAGVRAHLSKEHVLEGGPYFELAPAICHARFRDRGVSLSRLLPGIEVAVGTIIPMSGSLALDWSASHITTPDAGGFTPHSLTGETKRDGLDRGTVRIRLVLRR